MELAKLILEYLSVLIWPAAIVTICLVFRRQVAALLNRIRHAELPGGVAVDLDQEIKEVKALSAMLQEQHQEIMEVKALSANVQEKPAPHYEKRGRPAIPLTDANARMIQLGLRPSPSGLDISYYRSLASRTPTSRLLDCGSRLTFWPAIWLRVFASLWTIAILEDDSYGDLTMQVRSQANKCSSP